MLLLLAYLCIRASLDSHAHPPLSSSFFSFAADLLLRADKAQSKDSSSLSLSHSLSLSLFLSLSLSLFSFCLPENQHVKSKGGGLGQRMRLSSGIGEQIGGKNY
jgi:hypothetical protein